MDAENRLNAFRRDRKQRERLEKIKNYIQSPFNLLRKRMMIGEAPDDKPDTKIDCNEETETSSLLECSSSTDECNEADSLNESENNNLMGLSGWRKYITYFCLWAIPYILFIKAGFGAVYFCVTALIFIYFNTRTRPKLRDEPSAYSVFNAGCEPIEGALSSDQIEREIRSGMMCTMFPLNAFNRLRSFGV